MTGRTLGRERMPLRPLLLAVSLIVLVASEPTRAAESEASRATLSAQTAATFQTRCAACHTYGKGIKVGPDLKGVTERRTREWLVRFIRSSSSMIASGDPIGVALFAEFKQQRMPDWTEFSEKQIDDILEYLAAGGPDIRPQDQRSAETATAAEVELGRNLFDGAVRFTRGGQPCTSCHTARGSTWRRGGNLGPDLSAAYLEYQDKALTSFLREPCFRWDPDPDIGGDNHLTPRESFAVKAFLRQSALPRATAPASVSTVVAPAAGGHGEAVAAPPVATAAVKPTEGAGRAKGSGR
jgi:mono/diheme cytochrome c family protein